MNQIIKDKVEKLKNLLEQLLSLPIASNIHPEFKDELISVFEYSLLEAIQFGADERRRIIQPCNESNFRCNCDSQIDEFIKSIKN